MKGSRNKYKERISTVLSRACGCEQLARSDTLHLFPGVGKMKLRSVVFSPFQFRLEVNSDGSAIVVSLGVHR